MPEQLQYDFWRVFSYCGYISSQKIGKNFELFQKFLVYFQTGKCVFAWRIWRNGESGSKRDLVGINVFDRTTFFYPTEKAFVPDEKNDLELVS